MKPSKTEEGRAAGGGELGGAGGAVDLGVGAEGVLGEELGGGGGELWGTVGEELGCTFNEMEMLGTSSVHICLLPG